MDQRLTTNESGTTESAIASRTSSANEFVKGFVWGFVAFVHVALVTVLVFKFKLNCLPLRFVEALACQPPGSAKCATACNPSDDFLFYILVGSTILTGVLLPLGFGIYRAIKFRGATPAATY